MKHLAVICAFVILSAFCEGELLSAPNDLEASEITPTSVKLSWSYDTPNAISYYVIYHKPTNTHQASYSRIPGITSTHFDVQNLSPHTEYQFIVSPVGYDNGLGYPSRRAIVTTGELGANADYGRTQRRQARGELLSAPNDLEASEITPTSVKLSWSYDTPNAISYYVIYHMPTNTRQARYSQIPGITSTYFDVQNLSPYTEYQFIVAPVGHDNRRGYPSRPVVVTTGEPVTTWAATWDITTENYQPEATTWESAWYTSPPENQQIEATTQNARWYATTERRQRQGLPEPPENLQVSRITNTSVELTWSYARSDESTYFTIYYKPRHARQGYSEVSGIVSTYQPIIGLNPNTEYAFLVVGINSVGRGLPSEPAFVTTSRNEVPRENSWDPRTYYGNSRFYQ